MAVPVESVKLAPTTAADTSTSIVVENGQVVSIVLYAASLNHNATVLLERKVNGAWQPMYERLGVRAMLCEEQPEFAFVAPGEYRGNKGPSTGAAGLMEIR